MLRIQAKQMISTTAGRLRWRCRRGMRELDELLGRWLERRYPTASSEERAAFERILDLSDPDLARYLLGREPAPPEHRELLGQFLQLAGDGEACAAPETPDPRR